jgi:hypothetical protein
MGPCGGGLSTGPRWSRNRHRSPGSRNPRRVRIRFTKKATVWVFALL